MHRPPYVLGSASRLRVAIAVLVGLATVAASVPSAFAATTVPDGMTATITAPTCGTVVSIVLKNATTKTQKFRLRQPDNQNAYGWVFVSKKSSITVERAMVATGAQNWSVRYGSAVITSKTITPNAGCYDGSLLPYVSSGTDATVSTSCGAKAIITVANKDDSWPLMSIYRSGQSAPIFTTNVGQQTRFSFSVPVDGSSETFTVKYGKKTLVKQKVEKLPACVGTQQNNWGQPNMTDGFNGSTIDAANWWIYDSQNYPRRDPSMVTTKDGSLRLGGAWDPSDKSLVGGGVGYKTGQMYGHWEIKFRYAAGTGFRSAILLWPDDEKWPDNGEVDISEIFGKSRQVDDMFLHNGPDNDQDGRDFAADMTSWHVASVDWLPDRVTYYLDGAQVWNIAKPTDGSFSFIPSGSTMHLALQNDVARSCVTGCSGFDKSKTNYLYVDWVKQYSMPAGAQ